MIAGKNAPLLLKRNKGNSIEVEIKKIEKELNLLFIFRCINRVDTTYISNKSEPF